MNFRKKGFSEKFSSCKKGVSFFIGFVFERFFWLGGGGQMMSNAFLEIAVMGSEDTERSFCVEYGSPILLISIYYRLIYGTIMRFKTRIQDSIDL